MFSPCVAIGSVKKSGEEKGGPPPCNKWRPEFLPWKLVSAAAEARAGIAAARRRPVARRTAAAERATAANKRNGVGVGLHLGREREHVARPNGVNLEFRERDHYLPHPTQLFLAAPLVGLLHAHLPHVQEAGIHLRADAPRAAAPDGQLAVVALHERQ